jgi:hypothetical protein
MVAVATTRILPIRLMRSLFKLPQRLKPNAALALSGTAEAVPFPVA